MALDTGKKPGLTLVIGAKPKDEALTAPKSGEDSRTMAGKALIAALKRGDGAGIMDALEECVSVIDDGLDEEPAEDDEELSEESPF